MHLGSKAHLKLNAEGSGVNQASGQRRASVPDGCAVNAGVYSRPVAAAHVEGISQIPENAPAIGDVSPSTAKIGLAIRAGDEFRIGERTRRDPITPRVSAGHRKRTRREKPGKIGR